MVVGNVIFMNFIIAVVSQSFENCMSRLVAQGFKNKLELIEERECAMTDEEWENKEWFPRYLVLRRKRGQESGPEWQGLVREIKKE